MYVRYETKQNDSNVNGTFGRTRSNGCRSPRRTAAGQKSTIVVIQSPEARVAYGWINA
jgi:hypothetical protein